MVLLDNQVSSPKSVLDDKACEDSSNDSDFDADLYINDEEDNGDNVVVSQTPIKENDIGKEEPKDNLKGKDTLKFPNGKLTHIRLEYVYMLVDCVILCLLIDSCSQEHLEGNALNPWIPALKQGGATI
ncbi:hypothetical protein Tco_1197516 [Tanacetum coccineum]